MSSARRRFLAPLLLSVTAHGSSLAYSAEPDFRFRDVADETGVAAALEGLRVHGAAWGDANGDGRLDLYVGTFAEKSGGTNRLLLATEEGFQAEDQEPLALFSRTTGIVFADLDNDGDLDLYVGSMPKEKSDVPDRPVVACKLFENEGSGRFVDVSKDNGACPTRFGARSVAVLDFDGDGLLDLAVGEEPTIGYNGSATRSSRVFRNLGGLRFEDVARKAGIPENVAGRGVAAGDLNGDGWPDLFFASSDGGNALLLNDGKGSFREAPGARETFEWKDSGGDDMVCGVCFGDVDNDGLLDLALGQHYDHPWASPVANRLYLNRGVEKGSPRFEDVTERAGLVPLPLKAPHVEFQDFDNDGRLDLYGSMVLFDGPTSHPAIFKNVGVEEGVPKFRLRALGVNDFPTDEDRSIGGSGPFFAKLLRDGKAIYASAAPCGDFDGDGRIDLFLGSWWPERRSMLLKNETPGGNWLDVAVHDVPGMNAMGIGARISVYEAGRKGRPEALVGCREIAVGFGYGSGQEAVAHFGLGDRSVVDLVIALPHGKGEIIRESVEANRRLSVSGE